MSVSLSSGAHESQGHDIPLELELQVLVNCLAWVLGTTGPGSPTGATCALTCECGDIFHTPKLIGIFKITE